MAQTTAVPANAMPTAATPTAVRLRIDFLYLDLTTCGRCRATDRNLESALEVVRDVLEAAGVDVEVNRFHVESAARARELRLVTSPTIRVNGRDVALELRESSCEECTSQACTDGLGDQIACRVWLYRGREYTEAPVPMITDAILREVYGGAIASGIRETETYEMPGNLERFFDGKAAAQASCCGGAGGTVDCCASTGQGCG